MSPSQLARLPWKRRPPLWTCALVLAAAACDGPSDPGPPPVPTALQIVAGEGQADTVDAVAAQRLEVMVTDDQGKPIAGVAVQFTGDLAAGSSTEPAILVRAPVGGTFQRTASVSTDEGGKARVDVAMGRVAGPAQVVVTVPAQGLAATASFTVRPGAPVTLTVAPRDTGVYVDGSFALLAAAADRWQNSLASEITYTARGTSATTGAGGTVSGVAPGRTHVVVQVRTRLDSVAVSVVPRGVLVARRGGGLLPDGNVLKGLVSLGLDGSQHRVLTTDWAFTPRHLPDGTIAFSDGNPGNLRRIGTDGAVRRFLADAGTAATFSWPHPSRDGQWVYFTRFSEPFSQITPMRARADGSMLEVLPGFDQLNDRGHFSPSPDGTRFTYYMTPWLAGSSNVKVRVSAIGSADVQFETPGHAPEWSPTGEWIAYLLTSGFDTGPLRVIRPDGTGIRTVGEPAKRYHFGIDWSPDGRWIVATSATSGALELVNVETNEIIPLPPYAAWLREPSWKP